MSIWHCTLCHNIVNINRRHTLSALCFEQTRQNSAQYTSNVWHSIKSNFSNLTTPLKTAIHTLKRLHETVIKPADKGGAIVLWPATQYLQEAHFTTLTTTAKSNTTPYHHSSATSRNSSTCCLFLVLINIYTGTSDLAYI